MYVIYHAVRYSYIFRNYNYLKSTLSIRDLLTKFVFLFFQSQRPTEGPRSPWRGWLWAWSLVSAYFGGHRFSWRWPLAFSLLPQEFPSGGLVRPEDGIELVLIIQPLTSAIFYWSPPSFLLKIAFSLSSSSSLLPQQFSTGVRPRSSWR